MIKLLFLVAIGLSLSDGYIRVCYFTNWAQYRPDPGKYWPEDIDPTYCTHINYAFCILKDNQVVPFEWNDEDTPTGNPGLYTRVQQKVRGVDPNIQVLLAIGGWNHGTAEMTKMLATKANREIFIKSAIAYCRKWKFDGFDLDFEYPARRGSPPEDKERYTALVQEMDAAMIAEAASSGKKRLSLTMAVAAGAQNVDGYEPTKIVDYLKFISVMTYDLNGGWDNRTGENAPLCPRREEVTLEGGWRMTLNVEWGIEWWVNATGKPEKLVMGVPLYGRTFNLTNDAAGSFRGIGAIDAEEGPGGVYSRQNGFFSFNEICADQTLVHKWEREHKVPFAYQTHTSSTGGKLPYWVGYETTNSLELKMKYLIDMKLAGVMIWSLSLDDFRGTLCPQNYGKYPLMKCIKLALQGQPCVEMEPKPPADADMTIICSVTKGPRTTTAAPTTTRTTAPTTTRTTAPTTTRTAAPTTTRTTAPTTTRTTAPTTTRTTAPTTTTNAGPNTTPKRQPCADECDGMGGGVHVKFKKDCRFYCRCLDTEVIQMPCPTGTFWCNAPHWNCFDDKRCCDLDPTPPTPFY